MKFRNPFKRKRSVKLTYSDVVSLQHAASSLHADTILNKNILQEHIAKGGIRKASAPQWTADQHRHGGRVVKAMPRDLKRMKELSEKTDD